MDWRRCTPEWSHRRRHRHCVRLVSFLASDVIRHARNDCHTTSIRPLRILAFSGACALNKLRTFVQTEAHAVSS